MPVTGVFTSKQLIRGPGKLFADVTVPADGATELVLTEGVPADGKLLGFTDAGTAIISAVEQTEEVVDESATPIDVTIASEVLAFEVGLLQLADVEMIQKYLFPTGTAIAALGINLGGLSRIPDTAKHSYLLTWPVSATQYAHAMIYSGLQVNENNLRVSRTERMVANARFEGQAIASRVAGDYVGRLRIPTVTPT